MVLRAERMRKNHKAARKEAQVKDYQKVILFLYPKLARLTEDIGKIVEAKARASYSGKESAEACAQKILDYLYVRDCFAALKEDTDKVMEQLTREEKYLLEYKYFRRKKVLVGEFSDFTVRYCERTYFRRQKRLAGKLNSLFLRAGLSEEWFLHTFSGVPYMMAALESVRGSTEALVDKRSHAELHCAGRNGLRRGGEAQ